LSVFTLIQQVRVRYLGVLFGIALLIVNVIIFWGNLLYYRFFQVWINYDIFLQWNDFSPIAKDIRVLIKPLDIIFMVALPALLFAAALYTGRKYRPHLKESLGIMLAAFILFAVATLSLDEINDYTRVNPLLNMPRQMASMMKIKSSRAAADVDFGNIRTYFPVDTEKYTIGHDTDFPILKKAKHESPSPDNGREQKSNVVVILLESVRAFESAFYNNIPISYTPNIDRLAREGLAAKNNYAVSGGTVFGEFSALTSYYPSTVGQSVYSKYMDLNIKTLPEILKDNGYSTAWISGFSPDYGDKRAFWSKNGIDSFHYDYGPVHKKIGWGPSDEEIFANAIRVLSDMKEPFFVEVLTLSNHWPFDWPYPTLNSTPPAFGEKTYVDYTKGVYYTDYALGKFIQAASEKDFFENTIFVITSDHGVLLFPDSRRFSKVRVLETVYRSPLVFYGPGLIEPEIIHEPSSQVDIAPTVLDLLGIRQDNSFVGRSLLKNAEESRPVFIKMGNIWHLRKNDQYCYNLSGMSLGTKEDLLKRIEEQDYMNPETIAKDKAKSDRPKQKNTADNLFCFSTKRNLLEMIGVKSVRPLDDKTFNELRKYGDDLMFFSTYLLVNDKIWPPEKESPRD
jgi:phosphoglycerol transferase MdoB-like AlkP superfamily enzyme